MSTKIGIGQRAVNTNVFVVAEKIREVAEPIFKAEYERLVKLAEDNADGVKTYTEVFMLVPSRYEEFSVPITNVGESIRQKVWEIIERLNADPHVTFSPADIKYKCVLLPNGNGLHARPLVLVFSEKLGGRIREELIRQGVTEEYGYWNNVDRPDDISKEEWEDRKVAWDKMNVPSQDGLILNPPDEVSTVWSKYAR